MNNGWVGATDAFISTTVLGGTGSWFTDIVFVPLLEVADYGLRESLDPDGIPTKQERSRVLRMVGDLNYVLLPGAESPEVQATCRLDWYLGRFGKEETDNAVGNSLAGGLFNYDPLQVPAPFLYSQQAILDHRMAVMVSVNAPAQPPVFQPVLDRKHYRIDKKMSLPLRSDDELYLVYAATIAQGSEEAPAIFTNYLFRFLITD